MKQKLTRESIQSVKPTGRDHIIFDTLLSGFALRVSKIGTKTFVAHGRVNGRSRRVRIGKVGEMPINEARQRAKVILAQFASGDDPALSRVKRKAQIERDYVTIAVLMERFIDEHAKPKLKPRTIYDYEDLNRRYITPSLGALPCSGIERENVLRFLHDHRHIPRRANYSFSVLRKALNFAEDIGLRKQNTNPCTRVRKFPENTRQRYLSDDEIAAAIRATTKAEAEGAISPFHAAGIRLAIFTGMRGGEIETLKWDHVRLSDGIALLPDSKTGHKAVYLNAPAIDVLKNLPRMIGTPYVIAGRISGTRRWALSKAWGKVRKLAGLDDVRLHDLRHTFASVGARKGQSLQVIGGQLGHSNPSTTARYSHLAAEPLAAASREIGDHFAAIMARAKS